VDRNASAPPWGAASQSPDFGVGVGEIYWGRGKRREKKVKINVPYFDVTSEGLRPVYYVELGGEYFKKVWDRLSAARSMSEEEKRAFIDFVVRHLEGSGVDHEAFRQKLERWLGEWLAKAPGLKQHRVFHTLVNSLRELAQSEEDAGKRGVARRRAVGMLLHAVLGDGTMTAKEVRLVVGKGDKMSAEDKAALYYALLRELGYQPNVYKA
jgi:hypothetical protein